MATQSQSQSQSQTNNTSPTSEAGGKIEIGKGNVGAEIRRQNDEILGTSRLPQRPQGTNKPQQASLSPPYRVHKTVHPRSFYTSTRREPPLQVLLARKRLGQRKINPSVLSTTIETDPPYIDPKTLHPPERPPLRSRATRLDEPAQFPRDMIGLGPMWPTSGKAAGRPGYGYAANGTPLGATYIQHMEYRTASITRMNASSAEGSVGMPSKALKEIEQAGWGTLEDIAQRVAGSSRDGQLNVVNAKEYLRRRERFELVHVQSHNPEFDL